MTSQNRNDKTMATNPKTLWQGFSRESMVKKNNHQKYHSPLWFSSNISSLVFQPKHPPWFHRSWPAMANSKVLWLPWPKVAHRRLGQRLQVPKEALQVVCLSRHLQGRLTQLPKKTRNISFYWPQAKYTCIYIYNYIYIYIVWICIDL